MQNKNKHNKINKFDKFFDSNLFESKFIYITREPETDNVEPTPTETGQLEAESLVNRFDQRYSPEQIPFGGNSPDEVIYGVRNQMMEGPFNNFNVMSGGEILDRRVRRRLDYIRHNAPRYYKHIIDEEVRRRAGRPQTWKYRIANYLGFGLFRREWAEREVARDFFTYEHIRGGNYNTLATNLENQISALGVIGGAAFVDSRGNEINLSLPNTVN